MLYKLRINNLKSRCVIGVNPSERVAKQDVVINITVWANLAKAAKTDMIEDTINYASLSKNRLLDLICLARRIEMTKC